MHLALKPGHTVKFHGLKGAAHLNGTMGHLVEFHKGDRRWAVRCDDDDRVVKTKPENLKKWFRAVHLQPHEKGKGGGKELANGVADPRTHTISRDGWADFSPDMIIYPADPITMENFEKHDGYGVVSHSLGCNLAMIICADRLRKQLSRVAEEESDDVMRSLLDVFGIEPQVEEDRQDEAMAAKHKRAIQANLQNLERQACTGKYKNLAKEGGLPTYFLFIPLQRYFQQAHHDLTEKILVKYGCPQRVVIMKGYKNASVRIHKHGEASYDDDEKMIRPPNEDLIGPIPFGSGLRQQCPMTPLLALVHIRLLLQVVFKRAGSTLLEAKQLYLFPHALVISAVNPGHLCDLITCFSEALERFGTPSCVSQLRWARSSGGREENKGVANNELIISQTDTEHVSISKMIETVCWEGTNQYPFFSGSDGVKPDIVMHMALMKVASSTVQKKEDAVK